MTKEATNKVKRVLLIEDNPGDVRLTQEAFKIDDDSIELEVVMDGVEALSYLLDNEPGHQKIPDLILLDLNLPKKDGREVLATIRGREEFDQIPIIILTTSSAEQDIYKCYELKANCYINKPLDFDLFYSLIQKIKFFWLVEQKNATVST